MQAKEDGGIAYDMQLNRPENASGYNDNTKTAQKGLSPDEAMKILGRKVAEQFTHVQKAFRSLDADFSGSIGASEFKRLLARYNLYMDDAVYLPWFKSLDPDGSGELAFDEFIALFGKDIAGEAETGGLGVSIIDAAAKFKPHEPKIAKQRGLSCDEAEAILKAKMTDQFSQCSKAFRSFDYDHSGSVELPEFR